MTYSEKVKQAMEKKKLKKVDIYSALGVTPPTLTTRLEHNNWRLEEIQILNKMLDIKL